MTRGLGMEWGNNYLRMKIWWHPVVSANNHPALGYPYYSVLASRQKTGTLAVWSKKKDCVDLWRDPGQPVRGDSRAHQGQWGAGLRAFTSRWAAYLLLPPALSLEQWPQPTGSCFWMCKTEKDLAVILLTENTSQGPLLLREFWLLNLVFFWKVHLISFSFLGWIQNTLASNCRHQFGEGTLEVESEAAGH